MSIDGTTPERKEKAKNCKSTEELMGLAMSEGIELSRERLEGMSGGIAWMREDCTSEEPNCPLNVL